MASSSKSKPSLSAAALSNIPEHQHSAAYQHGTPEQDARMRAHHKRKDQRRFDEAHDIALNESLSLDQRSSAVIKHLLRRYPDQFHLVDGVCVRRENHVPMIQATPTMTLRPLIPVG